MSQAVLVDKGGQPHVPHDSPCTDAYSRQEINKRFTIMESYVFTKNKVSGEIWICVPLFGRHITVVLTKVNDFHYINLYNNNPRNPGRCFLGWDEFLGLTNMKEGLEQLFKQFEAAVQTQQPQPPQIQQPQKPTLQELIPPPPLCAAQAIIVIGSSNNKRPSMSPRCGLPSKKQKGKKTSIPIRN
ncbi:unnamed protein product [Mytilus edulis]|uniref:Uncharacterized protein n=1 Tax=Mytilus edulis TaxID=6550 RepID=A0A8S3VD83_MYTED|nr:unnamed protein product [Mytilus edulis]